MKRFPTPTEILSPQPISTINLIPTSTAFLPWSQAQPICWKGETSVSGWVTPWSGFQSQRIKRPSQRMGRVLWGILTATEMVNSLSGGIHGNLYIYIYLVYILSVYIYIYIDVCVYVEGRGFNSPIAILLLRGVATCVGLPKQQPLRPSICAENLRKHRLYWKQLGCPGSLQCPNQSWGHEFC